MPVIKTPLGNAYNVLIIGVLISGIYYTNDFMCKFYANFYMRSLGGLNLRKKGYAKV